jgi:hypothetical protein
MGTRWSLALLLLAEGCGGVATVDLFFTNGTPVFTGPANLVLLVMEGAGSNSQILVEHVEPFDQNLSLDVRIPYGSQRSLQATIESDDQHGAGAAARSGAFARFSGAGEHCDRGAGDPGDGRLRDQHLR